MRHTDPNEPGLSDLIRENEELKRQIREMKTRGDVPHASPSTEVWRPSATAIWAIFLAVVILIVVAFLAGYLPLQKRRSVIASEAHEREKSLQRVDVIAVARTSDPNA